MLTLSNNMSAIRSLVAAVYIGRVLLLPRILLWIISCSKKFVFRSYVVDELPHSGHPSTSNTVGNAEKVKKIVMKNF